MSGNTISNRLTEILINELGEGFDQLPVLQHALNQVWKQADKGQQEMDLIHLAKLSGLPESYLPAEDKDKFAEWFKGIPEFKKEFFKKPSLENVLNAHANELFETAHEFYNKSHSQPISKETACIIIKEVFQCLTKIDDGRAVRNLMTLEEITNIINIPEINTEIVGGILEIFREQGNTFLKPFITADESSKKLKKHDVLDITHESLIRNWDLLGDWAKEEYDNLQNFQDFNKQLQRWVNNKKAKGYLLPIGPLTFFEGWYNICKPNKYWLARYNESEDSFEEKLNKAEETITLANEFIKRSARKLFFTRTVMKYGANKLLTYLGVLLLICSCTFYYFDYRKKQNDSVLNDIEHRGLAMLKSNKISSTVKADFLINYERLYNGTFITTLDNLNCDTLAYDIANKMFLACQNIDDLDKVKPVNPIIFELMDYLNKTLDKIYNDKKLKRNDPFFKRFGEFVRLCAFIKSYEKNHSNIDDLMKQNVNRIYNDYVLAKLNQPVEQLTFDPIIFNNALELILNYSENKQEKAKNILSKLSPLENNDDAKKKFDKIYAKEHLIKYSWRQSYTHNAGYQELGYLYAVNGNADKINSCYDSIIKYNLNYKTFYRAGFNELALYILSSDLSREKLNLLFKKYETYSGLTHLKCIESLIYYLQPYVNIWYLKKINSTDPYTNLGYSVSYNSSDKIFDYYLGEIKTEIKDKDDLAFKLALYYKLRGMNLNNNLTQSENYFDKAYDYYSSLSKDFISKDAVIGTAGSANSKNIKKSILFLYPKPISDAEFYQPYYLGNLPNKLFFINYLQKKHSLTSLYYSKDEWKMFETFIDNIYTTKIDVWSEKDSINYAYFNLAEKFIHANSLAKANLDSNYVYLTETEKYFELNDTANALKYYKKTDARKILSEEFQKGEENKGDKMKNLLKQLATNFATNTSSTT